MTTTVAGAAHSLRDTGDRHRSPALAPVPVGWPAAAGLVDRLLRVLGSAEQAVRVLVPAGWHDPSDPDVAVRAEKVIAETALLLLALAPAARQAPELQPGIDRLAADLLPHASSPAVRAAITSDPTMALDHAFGAICLGRLGYQDASFSRLFDRYLDQSQLPGRERLPHRALEQSWLAGLAGRPPAAASRAELCRQSILGCGLDLLQQRRDDLYACTHAIMYATNLGTDPVVLPRPAMLGAELDAAIAVSLDRHDYDLAGELLACCFMVGGELSATARFGFEVLLDVEDQAGFLPAPTLQLDRLAGLHGSDRARYLFAASYHTIYVMGLLCAQALCRGPGSPATAGPDGPELAVEGLDESRHWWPRYAASSPERQDALRPVLVNIALHRAIAAHDLGRVARILSGLPPAVASGLPAAVQASQLLARATVATLG